MGNLLGNIFFGSSATWRKFGDNERRKLSSDLRFCAYLNFIITVENYCRKGINFSLIFG